MSLLNLNAQIKNGIRISFLTDNFTTEAQENFINTHFDYVMTPVLSDEMREKYDSVSLFLYRSLRGTWPDTLQFDWNFITTNENMFCHYDSTDQSSNTRILTKYGSYLMNGNDLVSDTASDALNHWINYYAVTASQQVDSFNYDGLFMDSAGHKLDPDELADSTQMPWDYSDSAWREMRYADIAFVKAYLPDKTVIFNGLHSQNGADSSLHLCDGGMWEDFAFNCDNGNYKGVGTWWQAITCMQDNRDFAKLILTVKKPGLNRDTNARIFSVASYLLIENENTILTLSDYDSASYIQYYPEFQIDLGNASDDFYYNEDSVFIREFENGLVLVNPFSDETKTYELPKTYYKVSPVGGGTIDSSANYNAYLSYQEISGSVTLPPVSAIILKDTAVENIVKTKINNYSLKTYPNPFDNNITIEFNLTKKSKATLIISDENGKTVKTIISKKKLQAGNHSFSFNTSSLPKGLYICTLKTNSIRISQKVLKK